MIDSDFRTNPRHAGPKEHLTIVIKLGTSSIVNDDATHLPKIALLSSIVETAVSLIRAGHRVVIVSSGAIGVGLKRMDMARRPKGLAKKQALAAIGQGRLIALWDNLFSQLSQPISQILLTRGDISDRTRYLNAVNTFSELLDMGVVPIVNENDTISVSEIKFGDNDTLSAITAAMVHADYLFLMTDVDCLYTDNPRKNPDARPISVVNDIAEIRKTVSTSTMGSSLGTGGMETKIIAAELATGAGVTTVVCHGAHPERIFDIITAPGGEEGGSLAAPPHTAFLAKRNPLRDRKWWILNGLHPAGEIVVDLGAAKALIKGGGRLLPAGVVAVKGAFAIGQAVSITIANQTEKNSFPSISPLSLAAIKMSDESYPPTPNLAPQNISSSVSSLETSIAGGFTTVDSTENLEFGRGLANYNSTDIDRVKGHKSSLIADILGFADSEHVVEQIVIKYNPFQTSTS
ncbi:glutamate 5-kinase [Wallemia mellicola CBS 633.66]|uniref:Glutamate 5-kinase n=1 Tax=Wallemia mellicola (strain ATCC MYA-4683 / CBS 633.66) TaxID=671144 RepID=I4YGI2_WALMC|nr:glutamate 5-kinase [Wallemia mellicola CBS 633.66]EIM23074.1 glutamate 5-kinase [Wallemia mellicola CBS 633.66]|eukprot:XP_006957107.1 glutamate 5-kinase [Wallemia mellicola CBS 633.66]